MRLINEISVHCSATNPDWMENEPVDDVVAEIRRWHVKNRGWSDIGYHYLIHRDGSVGSGRPIERGAAAIKGRNNNIVAVCLIGGRGSEAGDDITEHFTQKQIDSLIAMIGELQNQYPSIKKVTGHNRYAAKACPGFRVDGWMGNRKYKKPKENLAQSKTMLSGAATIGGGLSIATVTQSVSSLGGLSGTAQIAMIALAGVVIVAGIVVMRERIRHWFDGVR